jgi:hypothetical protein
VSAKPSDKVSDDAPNDRGDLERPPAASPYLIRAAVGGLGLAGLVVGGVIAWRSESATTLLVVSALMLFLAALGLEWSKIRAEYRGVVVELLRGVGADIEEAKTLASAATEDASPSPAFQQIVEKLDAAAEQVNAAVLKALAAPERPRRPRSSSSAEVDELMRDLLRTKTMHAFRGQNAVQLSLRTLSKSSGVTCTVTTPDGATYSAATRRPISLSGGNLGVPVQYTVIYPDEFDGAEPLTPGRYGVEWRASVDLSGGSVSPLVAALAQMTGSPVAVDSFTIPSPAASAT